MRQRTSAAALAILLVTAGIAGVVSADPTSTDTQPTQVAPAAADRAVADAGFEAGLADRLRQFDLTDAQIRAIVTEAARLRDDGASRLVIRSSIVMNLYGYGVDAPILSADADSDRPDPHDRLHRVIAGLDVTPAQARELHAMAHRLHDAGATHAEIHATIRRQVAAWSDDDPDASDGVDRFVDRVADRYGLSDAEAADVERLVRRMLADGAHRGEIKAAVSRLVRSFDDGTATRGTAGARLDGTRPR